MARNRRSGQDEIVVFWSVQSTACSDCGDELARGRFFVKAGDGIHCLPCAEFDHLVFLERGDAALTRRAGKHSSLRVVVVRFSRARKRYERQGILIEPDALERAEQECVGDEEARKRRRERMAERRAGLDAAYVEEFARRVRARYPGAPAGAEEHIAEHACSVHSRRVGRTAAAKEFDSQAIDLAVAAHVRHAHTDYDRLFAQGWERPEARERVGPEVRAVLARWRERG